MYRGRTISLSFPPFAGWVRRIVLACAAIYLLQVLLGTFSLDTKAAFSHYAGLVPYFVVHYGMIWQLVTYAFLHGSVGHILVNMLMLWMFGSQLEQGWGPRKFIEFYLFCVVGAALLTIGVAYMGWTSATIPTVGASGGIYGVLIAFAMLYGNQEVFMFPLPFLMKAKYMVAIMVFLVIIATFQPQGGIANFAHLGGLLFGFLYVKFLPRQGLLYALSERYYGLRNEYYRGKRRRAARKFEVYMREQGRDPGSFDEYGNYRPPADKKNGDGKSGWVN
jgi:membrane associated rhomboid family serine protease